MFKQLQENLNSIFGSKQNMVSKNYCKCGAVIKCSICKTKKTLKDLIDETDPSITKTQVKIQCRHALSKYCKKCQAKIEIARVFKQSLSQENYQKSKIKGKIIVNNEQKKAVQNEQNQIRIQTDQNYLIRLKLQKTPQISQQIQHQQILIKIDE